MNNQIAMVPIHLDGLLLPKDSLAVEAFTDFSRLPFYKDGRDYNPDTPNLSESVLSVPFQNRNLNLRQGMHLHWSLPDALTKGGDSGTDADFPAAPNRWLVVRTSPNKGEKRWVVESDYLSMDTSNPYHAVAYPTDISQAGNGGQPFGFLGRQLDITDATWSEDTSATRLSKLTALGYGEPAFAAFYPNCHSVFGCIDPDIKTQGDLADLKYQIIGWYGEAGQDPLHELTKGGELSGDTLQKKIEEAFAWKIEGLADNQTLGTCCYAELDFNASANITNPDKGKNISVSIGNTGTEALSAYLASGEADKTSVEEQLESLLLHTQLQNKDLDLGARFQEARHEKGFKAESGGSLWELRPAHEDPAHGKLVEIDLPLALENDLDTLNQQQQAWNQAVEQLRQEQQLLFTDWYKYMLCAYPPEDAREDYPDIDKVRYYIERQYLRHDSKLNQLKQKVMVAVTSLPEYTRLRAELENWNDGKPASHRYVLKQVAAPRFWHPTEPVVLLEGEAVMPTNRHGADGRMNEDNTLTCHLQPLNNATVGLADFTSLFEKINTIKNENVPEGTQAKVGFDTWQHQPWHPFLLEWEVEMFPMQAGGNLNIDNRNFQPDFITSNYTLAKNQPDLGGQPGKSTIQAAALYNGRSVLTPFAKDRIGKAIEEYLKDHDDLEGGALSHAKNKLDSQHFLSQALSGFNNALLMQHQTLQLPLHDPIGFGDYQIFTQQVQQALAGNNNLAPLPLNDFLPIRSGTMRLHKLRLIDNFGQIKEVAVNDIIRAEPLQLPQGMASGQDAWLPPRLVQPARVNFRWLTANGATTELNTHPESSPVAGWLLANHLDNSVVVYDQAGFALGIIDQTAQWRGVPGTDAIVHPSDIANAALRRVVRQVLGKGASFLDNFIKVTDAALQTIDPEGFAHHQALALLMGRPIAVVRTSLGLEVKGSPAVHHGWTEFRQDMQRGSKETDQTEQVKVPVRVGEPGQLNDGVLGYWQEEATEGGIALSDAFYTTANAQETHEHIKGYDPGNPDLKLSLAEAPQTITMLLDPRGEAHATTGMLPAKVIDIPKYQYAEALKRINISFLSAPVLMEANKTVLPLPNEPGYTWSWLERDRFAWHEVARHGVLLKTKLQQVFGAKGDQIWQELITKGWIEASDPGKADIVPKDQRPKDSHLVSPLNEDTDQIEDVLAQGHIVPPETKAAFRGGQTIKEGWLRLSPNPKEE
ncbi:hypothetical protein [Microscilla marina]|uniref:Uncharacterized protein n=1 Tax=Microscilla marina ATCC 23134 TaxID=313606 RepID=A1ZNA5_MICM2|nr:hypothetical protein [Microscilla marina]EAY28286.1 conserved hypothetical protein [Microscilla marina ATCC 23134]